MLDTTELCLKREWWDLPIYYLIYQFKDFPLPQASIWLDMILHNLLLFVFKFLIFYLSLTFFFFNKFIYLFIYLFIYFWLCWVFVSVRGLSPVAASRGHSSSRCAGLSLLRPLLLRSTGSRRAGSVVVAHGPSCSAARGILPDQGSNPRPLHWQADSQPLCHQGSPYHWLFYTDFYFKIFTLKYYYSSF